MIQMYNMQLKKLGEWPPTSSCGRPGAQAIIMSITILRILQTHTHVIRGKLALAALISISKRVRNTKKLSAFAGKGGFRQ